MDTKPIEQNIPAVISSDMARKKYEENLIKLQGFETQYQNTQNITPIAQKSQPNMKGVL